MSSEYISFPDAGSILLENLSNFPQSVLLVMHKKARSLSSIVISGATTSTMEPPEEIDRPKTSGSPVSVGFLEDNSTVISGDVESTPADQRVWSVLSLSGESLKTTGIINTAICWTDVLSAKASTIGTLQSLWIPAIPSLGNLQWSSPDFIARVRVKLMWESLYHVHFALQTTNGRLLAQLGRSWQIEAKDSDNFASFSSAGSRRRKPHPLKTNHEYTSSSSIENSEVLPPGRLFTCTVAVCRRNIGTGNTKRPSSKRYSMTANSRATLLGLS